MKYFIFFFAMISITKCFSQKLPIAIKEGIYSGGICLDAAICGEWILKMDSSFVFIEFDKSCIKKIGMGNITTMTDSFISVQFNKFLPVLSNSKIEYLSETRESYDSIYVNGQLINKQNQPISYASIVYDDKRSTVSDSKGYFNAVFPLTEKVTQIDLINKIDGYPPLRVKLNQNHNYHRLIITIPKIEPASCATVENFEMENNTYTFRIIEKGSKRSSSLSLTHVSNDKKNIITKLLEAKLYQPFLKSSIDALINYISN
jgi:hypothetical protein